MNPIVIKINPHEYDALRAITKRQEALIKAHFAFQKSAFIQPEIVVACMFDSHFREETRYLKFPKNGLKKFKLHYFEAQALFNILGTFHGMGYQNIRDQLDKEITDWRPSFTFKTCEDWYNKSGFQDRWGDFNALDDTLAEAVEDYFNKKVLPD